MKTKLYITNGKRTNNKIVTKTMCRDKNEVISYYRYINIPGQVRVRLVIDTEALRRYYLIIKYGFQFGNEETFTNFKIYQT